jgi:hypothetical protein
MLDLKIEILIESQAWESSNIKKECKWILGFYHGTNWSAGSPKVVGANTFL